MPALLFLVFETGGHAYALKTLEEAGDSLEALDLTDGHYVGAFSDQGEIINMSPGDLWINFFARRELTTMTKTLVDRPVDGCGNFLELRVRRGAFTAELPIVAEYDAAEPGAKWRQVRAARRVGGLDKPRPIISGRGEFISANHRDAYGFGLIEANPAGLHS